MTFKIVLSAPDVGELEQSFVLNAMSSGWVAPAGPDLDAFETEVADRVGVEHAVGLASGTAALHLALVSWGVGPGDVVPVSTFTFAATVNAIRYVGATPYLVDCNPATANIDPDLLKQAMGELSDQGQRIPVVIPVDLLGKSADHTAIARVLEGYPETRVLSDAAESFGATHDGRPAGGFGDASVVSFNGNKILTTSGGGMLLTNDKDLALHVRKLSTQAREPVPHYEHQEVGYNYRLSNILAALGRGQLRRLNEMLQRRREWRERYRAIFEDSPGVHILGGADDAEDNCWLTAIVIDPHTAGWNATWLGSQLAAAGIETRPVWKPMHRQPVFHDAPGVFNGTSDELFANGLTLPSGSGMSDDDFESISTTIGEALRSR
jgi:dTDP-4-amino-4,6-dideoxygalactose transaminase